MLLELRHGLAADEHDRYVTFLEFIEYDRRRLPVVRIVIKERPVEVGEDDAADSGVGGDLLVSCVAGSLMMPQCAGGDKASSGAPILCIHCTAQARHVRKKRSLVGAKSGEQYL